MITYYIVDNKNKYCYYVIIAYTNKKNNNKIVFQSRIYYPCTIDNLKPIRFSFLFLFCILCTHIK